MKKRDDSESLHLLLSYWYGKIKEKKMVWQGTWRDANTGKVLDLTEFWAPGQVLAFIWYFFFKKLFSYTVFFSPAKRGEGAKLC